MEVDLLLSAIVLFSVMGKANSVAVGAGLLLLLRLTGLQQLIQPQQLEKSTMFWGLALITVSVLAPFATGRLQPRDALSAGASLTGAIAFALSLLTTWLSGRGLYFMTEGGRADLLPVLIVGSMVAATFLKGVPVGPLTTSGILYVITRFMGK
ncbi:MAG: DUF441 family protein [Bacillota bacterium]